MRVISRLGLGVALGGILFYMVASGCTWISFSATDSLLDKIVIRSSTTIQSIYLEFTGPTTHPMSITLAKFQEHLKSVLAEKGYIVSTSPEGADLVAKFNVVGIKKNSGTQYFFLGIFPNDGFEGGVHKVDGVQVDALYRTSLGKWSKRYRTYYSDSDKKVAAAIIADLNQAIIKKRPVAE